jgi:hypothetical protein
VTAHARCRLHRQIIKIGPERILYCDTDSILFSYSRHASNCLDLSFPYGTLFSRYSHKKFDIVISKRLLIPLLTEYDIVPLHFLDYYSLSTVGRIDTVPFGF